MAARWTDLVPGPFPELHFAVRCEGVDLLALTRDFDFAPLLEVHRGNSERAGLDFENKRWFINASRFESFRVGANCYTYYLVTIARDGIEIETNYGDAVDAYHDRVLALLHALPRSCRYEAWSSYADSGECSEARSGDLADVLGA